MFDTARILGLVPHFADGASEREKRRQQSDPLGNLTNAISRDYKFLAIAAYFLGHDVPRFRELLSRAAELQVELFQRQRVRGDVFHQHVDITAYRRLLWALTATNWELARKLAGLLAGDVNNQFDNAFGYALKHCVLGQDDTAWMWLERIRNYPATELVDRQRRIFYEPWFAFLREIVRPTGIAGVFDNLLQAIDAHHRQQCCQDYTEFYDTEEELISFRGVAFANLARFRGIVPEVRFASDLIPRELIV